MSILAIVLCSVVIISAIWADRSARSNHRFRAIGLNLCGIACLAIGFAAFIAWSSSSGIIVTHDIAAANTQSTFLVSSYAADPAATSDDTASDATQKKNEPQTDAAAAETAADKVDIASAADETAVEPADKPTDEPAEVADKPALEAAEPDSLDLKLPSVEDLVVPDVKITTPSLEELIDYEARPKWVEQADVEVGPLHQYSVTSDEVYLKVNEAREDLYRQLKRKTDEYINQLIGSSRASYWIGLSDANVRNLLVGPDKIYDEEVRSTVSTMHQSHALLEFDANFRDEMEGRWHAVVARAQLIKVALVAGVVLGMLALIFGFFNADTATRGFYTGRLKFGTLVAILGLVALGFVLARSMPWIWV